MAIITKEGLLKLRDEFATLALEEKEAVSAVVVARSFGDFSENAELDTANAWLERTRKRMQEVEQRIMEAEIFDIKMIDKDKVGFGAMIEVEDLDNDKLFKYKIVSDVEANVQESKISVQSPLAKAVHGKKVGDECTVAAPAGEKILQIKSIDYSWLS